MMMCTRCKKRPAVVFVSPSTDMNATQGYCLVCAKELGIKPVNDIMEKMGITEEQLEAMTESMNDLMSMSDDGSFEPGGAVPFPSELLGQFGMNANGDGTEPATRESQPNDKKKKENFHKSKRKHIAAYCTDLTMTARNGELDAIIGREREIERVVQILSRRTKNNPCLIGEPGVGKTAVAEGLALRIAAGEVPAKLRKKEVQLLDLTALVAGTQFRGQFESRIKGLVDEVKQDGNIILFIDEVHNLVGTGDAEGSMNAANILKPALSRGEIQVIGATTFSEYRKYIEKDAALERRFQPVTVTEPSIDDATDIIRGIKNYYEKYHNVRVSDQIAKRIVVLSERYISDRYLPDKAIDLLDEACACAALRNKKLADYEEANLKLEKQRKEERAATVPVDNSGATRPAVPKRTKSEQGIVVEGLSNCLVKFSKCCTPVPGDEIVGFITRGYGVSVHRCDCPNAAIERRKPEERGRWIKVSWGTDVKESYQTALDIYAKDRLDLVLDVSAALSSSQTRVASINATTTADGFAVIHLSIFISDAQHLAAVMRRLHQISGVMKVDRPAG